MIIIIILLLLAILITLLHVWPLGLGVVAVLLMIVVAVSIVRHVASWFDPPEPAPGVERRAQEERDVEARWQRRRALQGDAADYDGDYYEDYEP